MNADLIVVVEKGKIIEKGSHEHLISKNGRYADLWSKQAFLKPHKYSEEEDSAQGASAIVNDLSADETAAELSKVQSQSSSSQQGSADDKHEKTDTSASTPSHGKEVSNA